MRVKEYQVLVDCVERGINLGWTRAHKHSDTPCEARIKDAMQQAVMLEVCEYFDFAADEEEQ